MLSRWFDAGTVETPKAKFLDIILYRWVVVVVVHRLCCVIFFPHVSHCRHGLLSIQLGVVSQFPGTCVRRVPLRSFCTDWRYYYTGGWWGIVCVVWFAYPKYITAWCGIIFQVRTCVRMYLRGITYSFVPHRLSVLYMWHSCYYETWVWHHYSVFFCGWTVNRAPVW